MDAEPNAVLSRLSFSALDWSAETGAGDWTADAAPAAGAPAEQW
jgi:hypothetical protein